MAMNESAEQFITEMRERYQRTDVGECLDYLARRVEELEAKLAAANAECERARDFISRNVEIALVGPYLSRDLRDTKQ